SSSTASISAAPTSSPPSSRRASSTPCWRSRAEERPMSSAFKAGLIQTNVSNEMAENVAFVREQARLARDAGADFVMTPENTGLIGADRGDTLAKAETEDSHAMLAACRAAARDTGAWFLL